MLRKIRSRVKKIFSNETILLTLEVSTLFTISFLLTSLAVGVLYLVMLLSAFDPIAGFFLAAAIALTVFAAHKKLQDSGGCNE